MTAGRGPGLRLEPFHLPLIHVQQEQQHLPTLVSTVSVERISRYTLPDTNVIDSLSEGTRPRSRRRSSCRPRRPQHSPRRAWGSSLTFSPQETQLVHGTSSRRYGGVRVKQYCLSCTRTPSRRSAPRQTRSKGPHLQFGISRPEYRDDSATRDGDSDLWPTRSPIGG
jgi:hypothetical protein